MNIYRVNINTRHISCNLVVCATSEHRAGRVAKSYLANNNSSISNEIQCAYPEVYWAGTTDRKNEGIIKTH